MAAGKAGASPALGFLTVLDHPQHGLFGGYLLLNMAGRPLEFHCTAPVKPNRAQQILYGPTLESFLYGEQIAATLIAQQRTEPLVLCTDREPVLAVRELVPMPVALVIAPDGPSDAVTPNEGQAAGPSASASGDRRALRLDAPHPRGPRLISFDLGRNRLAVSEGSDNDQYLICERLAEAARALDLAEPFTRIREAIEEAQQAAR